MTRDLFSCRACAGTSSDLLLDLEALPLANAFVRDDSDAADRFRAPLALVMCRSCRLIQLRDLVPREVLFSSYLWMTGISESARRHATWLAARLRERHHRGGTPLLVEIASNDGFFLQHFREAGFEVLGVDPSNFADEANGRGLPSIRDFFGRRLAEAVRGERGPAQVIVARNVFGHASELADLVDGAAFLLAPGGRLVIEVPYAYFLREELQYDTVFHEHVSYLTVLSLANLLARFGLKLVDLAFVAMNGGSVLCEGVHQTDPAPAADRGLIELEAYVGLNRPEGWGRFAAAVEGQRRAFRQLLADLKAAGRTVAGYGAAAKCMTMLNYCGISPDLMRAIGDANPRKQGLMCPGVRIPVVSPEALMVMRPDYVVIGAWNLKDEIMSHLRERHAYRGRFIVPLPTPVVVE